MLSSIRSAEKTNATNGMNTHGGDDDGNANTRPSERKGHKNKSPRSQSDEISAIISRPNCQANTTTSAMAITTKQQKQPHQKKKKKRFGRRNSAINAPAFVFVSLLLVIVSTAGDGAAADGDNGDVLQQIGIVSFGPRTSHPGISGDGGGGGGDDDDDLVRHPPAAPVQGTATDTAAVNAVAVRQSPQQLPTCPSVDCQADRMYGSVSCLVPIWCRLLVPLPLSVLASPLFLPKEDDDFTTNYYAHTNNNTLALVTYLLGSSLLLPS